MRIRTIKPEFWAHPVLAKQSDEVRLGALGLISMADDDGFFMADPVLIRNTIFPFDETSRRATVVLRELSRIEFVAVREHPKHGAVGLVVNFKKHQVVNKPQKSSLKRYFEESTTPVSLPEYSSSTTVALREPNGSDTVGLPGGMEWNGREGNGKEGNSLSGSGEPDGASLSSRKTLPREEAREIIAYLNEKAERNFRDTDENVKMVALRLHEVDGDVAGIKQMIDRQVASWKGDAQMDEYLRIPTLFNKTKFSAYYDNRNLAPQKRDAKSRPADLKIQIAAIEAAIGKHPANRESVYHKEDCTPSQKENLKMLKANLEQLKAQLAEPQND